MHILQHTIRCAIYPYAKVGMEPVIPRAFQIADVQRAADQRLFQIEPHHDVQIILHFV